MENELNQSQESQPQPVKRIVGVTFRIEQADLDRFKALCEKKKTKQVSQFVEWIRQATEQVSSETGTEATV
jgi:hypothetical protein